MKNNKIIVADAGPLIAFARLNQLELLAELFGRLDVPSPVFNECIADTGRPGASVILAAALKLIHVCAVSNINNLAEDLGAGEASAIQLALEQNARLLIDEKLGRKVADSLNISIIGTVGVLLLAKKKKLVKAIKPLLMQLLDNNYYLSQELIEKALNIANEK